MTTNGPRARHLRAGTIAIAVALTVAVILALAGCSDSDSNESGADRGTAAGSGPSTATGPDSDSAPDGESDLAPAGKPLASVTGDKGLIARILKFERSPDGNMTVFATVENPNSDSYLATDWIDGRDNMYSLAGSSVLDWKQKLRHRTNLDEKGACICTTNVGSIDAGETIDVWVSFLGVSEETSKVDLQLANFPVITGIPLPPAPKTGPTGAAAPLSADPPPAVIGFQPYDLIRNVSATVRTIQAALARPAADTSDPRVYDIVARVESVDGGLSLTMSNSTQKWGIQTRLLFAKDSAQLSPKAQKEIRSVADEVAKAFPTEPVQINGYTDNLGSTAHGLTLSRQRAEAIREIMEKAAPGVTFQAKGFGEKNPIADNGTEKGRERNRRAEIVLSAPGT
ncbi:OmpA family protein [Streptomyces niveus]|uniref:OmpA family protein n=1 Tax=Streptomyces niveus TaxID=193462 RepID=UPI0034181C0A